MGGRVFGGLSHFEHLDALRSVNDFNGESDLEWRVRSGGDGKVYLALFENKIDAAAQPDQCLRYRKRGEALVLAGECHQFSVSLIAPGGYASKDSREYDYRIDYEEIIDYFNGGQDEYSRYFAEIYDLAITRFKHVPEPIKEATQFRQWAWELANRDFPDLKMPAPPVNGTREYWINIPRAEYAIVYKLYRKNFRFTDAVVDLQIDGRVRDLDALQEIYADHINGTPIKLVKAGASFAFRIAVGVIDPFLPASTDEETMRNVFEIMGFLESWWKKTDSRVR